MEGLSTPTVVTGRSGMEMFDVRPVDFDEALRRAVEDDAELGRRSAGAA